MVSFNQDFDISSSPTLQVDNMSKRRSPKKQSGTLKEVNFHKSDIDSISIGSQKTLIGKIFFPMLLPIEKKILRGVFFLFLFLFWALRYPNFLYMAQEYDLFSWRSEYFICAVERIAGFSRFLSSFFIQFFYFPILGSLILAVFGVLTQYLTEKVFNLNNKAFILSFLPTCFSTLLTTNINYFLFERIDVAYVFSFIFNFCFMLFIPFFYEKIQKHRNKSAYFITILFITYPIFGFFSLVGGFLCVIKEFKNTFIQIQTARLSSEDELPNNRLNKSFQQKQRERCEFLLLLTLLTPCLFWIVFSNTTPSFYHMYTAGLWEESTLTQGRESLPSNFFTPFVLFIKGKGLSRDTTTNSILNFCIILETLFYILLPVFEILIIKFRSKSKVFHKRVKRLSSKQTSIFAAIGLTFICFCIYFFSFSSENYQGILRIARSLDKENWKKILEDEAKVQSPINPLITARILALVQTNRLADEAFKRPLVPLDSYALRTIGTFSMCGDRILYEYGCVNLAERTAVNNLVTKNDRSIWALKTLILCAIANQRVELAQRYLYRLQGTLFHKKTAQELAQYLYYKEPFHTCFKNYLQFDSSISPKRLEELDSSFKRIRNQIPHHDDLSSSNSVEHVRYRIAQEENLSEHTIQECENYLATLLISRNFPRYGKKLDEYLVKKGNSTLPRYIQESILFRQKYPQFFTTNKTEQWNPPPNVQIDANINTRFKDFISHLNVRESDEAINAKLLPIHGDTLWFFFGATNNIRNY